MSQIIDFTGPSEVYAKIIAAQGAALAFRGGTNTVISAWQLVDAWQYPAYSPVTTYNAGQSVAYAQKHFTCDVNGTIGVTPGTDPLRWSLNANQPQFVSGLNTTDGAPTTAFLPWTPPTGAVLTVKGFNEASYVDPNALTITSGVAFQAPNNLNLLFISGAPLPYITGVNY